MFQIWIFRKYLYDGGSPRNYMWSGSAHFIFTRIGKPNNALSWLTTWSNKVKYLRWCLTLLGSPKTIPKINHVTRHFRDLRERTRHNTIPPDFRDAELGFLLANLLWISRRNLDISIFNKDLETANCLYIKKEKFNVLFILFIMYRIQSTWHDMIIELSESEERKCVKN